MNLHKFLRLFDAYSTPINFTYKGSLTYRTAFGGCVTISLSCLIFAIFVAKLTMIGNVDYQKVAINQVPLVRMGLSTNDVPQPGRKSRGVDNPVDLSKYLSSASESGMTMGFRIVDSVGNVLKPTNYTFGKV